MSCSDFTTLVVKDSTTKVVGPPNYTGSSLIGMSLAKRCKQLRKDHGWSQTKLAERAGVSQQTISKIERGVATESRKLQKIAAAFGLSVDEFLESTESDGSTGPWPFKRISPEQWNALEDDEKAFVEGAVMAALRDIEGGKIAHKHRVKRTQGGRGLQ